MVGTIFNSGNFIMLRVICIRVSCNPGIGNSLVSCAMMDVEPAAVFTDQRATQYVIALPRYTATLVYGL